MTSAYTTELTREQYEVLAELLPPPAPTGRPRTVDLRRVIPAILYILATGCAWALLPHDYPPASTVYYFPPVAR